MCDSLPEAQKRLEELLPMVKTLEQDSRKGYGKRKKELDIDHDLARRVRDMVEDLLPWITKVATLEA